MLKLQHFFSGTIKHMFRRPIISFPVIYKYMKYTFWQYHKYFKRKISVMKFSMYSLKFHDREKLRHTNIIL